jgi:hypothetical protein
MLDSISYRALTVDKAIEISRREKIPMLEANQIKQGNGLER